MTATAQTRTVSPVTADTAQFTFYDIESLSNVDGRIHRLQERRGRRAP